jgi:hypothetical protein
MKRREFITLLGGMAIAAPRRIVAQTSKIYRVGTLTVGPQAPESFSSMGSPSAALRSAKTSLTRPAVPPVR